MKVRNTCVVMSELADLPELIPVGAEPVNNVIVVGEDAEALVHQAAQAVDSLDVGVFPGEKGIVEVRKFESNTTSNLPAALQS